MDLKHYVNTIGLSLLFILSTEAQQNNSMIQKPGNCYEKCEPKPIYQYWEETLPVYIGSSSLSASYLSKITLDTDNEGVIDIVLVTDTIQTKQFTWKTYQYKELLETNINVTWRETVCDQNRTRRLINKIQEKLFEKGYLFVEDVTGKVNKKSEAAMLRFQVEHDFYNHSFFNIEVLTKLGIKSRYLK